MNTPCMSVYMYMVVGRKYTMAPVLWPFMSLRKLVPHAADSERALPILGKVTTHTCILSRRRHVLRTGAPI